LYESTGTIHGSIRSNIQAVGAVYGTAIVGIRNEETGGAEK